MKTQKVLVKEVPAKEEPQNQPAKKFRAGAISTTIWRNKGQNAKGEEAEYSTISLERNYTDGEGKWHTTGSLRINDLPKAALLLQKAYEHLVLQHNNY
ncbi:hypothetical protein COV20_04755 [Candidatus Woesearchaeota archaeon CG10_big_fil_rev_8_21_14_0_10_45_16]|nr:MAG: hypothetical protein COV20_04755 [Candidatus Woesearchaeota archaeon CG10_big_fil_rev_8_21_14_0_10_45_16]